MTNAGLSDAIRLPYGACLDEDLDVFDVAGEPEDISGDAFGVLLPSTPALEKLVFTKTDPESGKLHMHLAAEHSRLMKPGLYTFRLRRIMQGGCEDNTPPIRVRVV